jgi:hypothetical protein
MIQAGLPVCIMVLLAEVCNLKSKKEMLGTRIPYLVCVPAWSRIILLDCWGYFIDERRPHTPLEVVAHLPGYIAMLVGLTLLMCGLDAHL